MCGSPLGDLFYLVDTLLDRGVSPPLPQFGRGDSWEGEGLRARLYRMYGEGQIGDEVFTALLALAEHGQLRLADLAVHQARAGRSLAGRGSDSGVVNALRGIRSRLAQLAQARTAAEKVLADLETRLADLDERMAGKERAARETIESDENAARQRLAEKEALAGSRDRLAAQAQALRADLARLDDLNAQLEAKSAEMEAVQARDHLGAEMIK